MQDYWVLTLIVLIVLVIINGIQSTLVTVAILLVVQYYIKSTTSSLTNNVKSNLPDLDEEISKYNESSLDSILSRTYQDADTSLSGSFIENGKKNKRAIDIRSHINNDNWKKYYNYEFNAISGENRDWWSNDDSELSRRHDISAFY